MPSQAHHSQRPTSGLGRYCCKSRKSNNPKNLAKVDLWTSLLLPRYSALVFVRLAHDRRLVAAVLFVLFLFLFLLLLVLFIGISGRHRAAHDHEGTPVDQPGGKFLGDVWGHVVAPWVWGNLASVHR